MPNKTRTLIPTGPWEGRAGLSLSQLGLGSSLGSSACPCGFISTHEASQVTPRGDWSSQGRLPSVTSKPCVACISQVKTNSGMDTDDGLGGAILVSSLSVTGSPCPSLSAWSSQKEGPIDFTWVPCISPSALGCLFCP